MDLADLIFEELRRRNTTLREFSRLTKVDHSTLSNIRNGVHRPSAATIIKIAPFVGKSEDELLNAYGYRSTQPAPARPQPLMPYAIPVYEEGVSAGRGEPVIQQYLYLGPEEGVPADWYGVPVQGECMIPVLFPEDIVIVNPKGVPSNGDIVVFDVEYEKALVKWFMKRSKGIFLEPENGERIPYDEETIHLQGVVMRTWRNPRRRARREYQQMWQRFMAAKQAEGEEEEAENGH